MRAIAPLALGVVLLTKAALACEPEGEREKLVAPFHEDALIVWDAAAGMQHLILSAELGIHAMNFGFVVPTPARPELVKVDNAFGSLYRISGPRYLLASMCGPPEYEPAPAPVAALVARVTNLERKDVAGYAAGVTVLERKRVAGYSAAILVATDAQALKGWLTEHGYATGPAFETWIKPYVLQGWTITVFKVEGAARPTNPWAASVRMSFKTPQAVFPYREPAVSAGPVAQGARLLRVFLLATERMEGRIGREPASAAWSGSALWSGRIDPAAHREILQALGLPAAAGSDMLWLTRFDDTSAVRSGDGDLYFRRSVNQSVVKERFRIFALYPGQTAWNQYGILIIAAIVMLLIGIALLACLVWIGWRAYKKRHA